MINIDMNKYQKGQIYKIVDVCYNKCYVGSTCEGLSQRMARHRHQYNSYLKGKHGHTTAFDIFDEYGIENCKIEWIEDCPCQSRKELEAREGSYIQNTKCVNKIMVGRTKEQYRQDNKERKRQIDKHYRETNKNKIKEKREEKKDYYDEYNKNWKANNKEYISEYNKAWNKKNKEHIAQKADCPVCGATVRKYDLKIHQKTTKCQSFLNSLEAVHDD